MGKPVSKPMQMSASEKWGRPVTQLCDQKAEALAERILMSQDSIPDCALRARVYCLRCRNT
jgi:hypothetical protein